MNLPETALYDLLTPLVNLAAANTVAFSHFAMSTDLRSRGRFVEYWHATMNNNAQFATDYTTNLLALMARQRVLLDGHMENFGRGTEHVASELTHAAVRAVAIATRARRNGNDRRVFPLPLPQERRQGFGVDRRLPLECYLQMTGT